MDSVATEVVVDVLELAITNVMHIVKTLAMTHAALVVQEYASLTLVNQSKTSV